MSQNTPHKSLPVVNTLEVLISIKSAGVSWNVPEVATKQKNKIFFNYLRKDEQQLDRVRQKVLSLLWNNWRYIIYTMKPVLV